ncbi:FGGY-family carbohydrate kinase [Dyadobacter jiangsuensis]|uniref:Autoinducer 2 (AI-2) kinase n=1 Tax=Dyadobacter jiangsuensis TaxID=1591085 RepID=A0A2P8FVE2_9BACT|nr:FGGY family carbohydrate kinase [Dyadobacter jiangsuensis]PSL25694.1 autoinducer 2 (AI-2) kinase [Dyadobacter jiangsuensis]
MTLKQAYLVADIGTGNVRVAIANPTGTILGVASGDMRYQKDEHYPESIFFDPDTLWEQIKGLAKTALAQAGEVTITAITATSQREGIVALDKTGKSLIGMPNIDHRGREWEDITPDKHEVYKLTGRYPTSLFSALKLVGVRERRPELWQQVSTFLSISDWAQYMFSGVQGYEHSQASETLLYDVEKGQWSQELCAKYQLDTSLLPQLVHSGTILGRIQPDIATELGISDTAEVVVGGSDTQLAILSIEPSVEDIVIVSGTTTPIIKIADHYITDARERTWTNRHTDHTKFLLEANAGVTGLNYQRLKEIFYPNEPYELIETEVAAIRDTHCVGALGSLLAGEQSPLIRGGFIFNTPVSHQLSRAHFVWATLWDIACSISENYNVLREVTNHEQDYVWMCGGGVRSGLLRQFIANLLGKKVLIRTNYRQASVSGGVAICNNALGIPNHSPETLEVTEPDGDVTYQEWYNEWKTARNTLKSITRQ